MHALARYVSANRLRAPGDFVEFIEKNDAVLFDRLECARLQLLFIEHLGRFLVAQQFQRVL